jgi:hypothetical protein
MQKTCAFENMDGPYCNADVRELLLKMRREDEQKNDLWKGLEKFKDLGEKES